MNQQHLKQKGFQKRVMLPTKMATFFLAIVASRSITCNRQRKNLRAFTNSHLKRRKEGRKQGVFPMQATLVYWEDEGWIVGKIKEIPGVFSQGETLDELKENIRDAYQLMMEDDSSETRADQREMVVAL
jgi:predicted RNase H-like HicB family nuclease